MLPIKITIKGSVVSVYRQDRHEKNPFKLWKRKIVDPEWLVLWYMINDGKFDEVAWLRLSDSDRDFMAFCVNHEGIHNSGFNINLAKDNKVHTEQLRIIEGELLAGNINDELVRKYKEILTMLSETGQLGKKHAGLLMNRMERTLTEAKKTATIKETKASDEVSDA